MKKNMVYYELLTCCLLFQTLHIVSSARNRRRSRTIDAAFSLNTSRRTFFLSVDEYIEYNLHLESEATVGPIQDLGLRPDLQGIQAAFTLDDSSVYLLKGCDFFRYNATDQSTTTLTFIEQGPVSNLGLPCDIDAAINWTGGVHVFKGCEMWTLNPNTSLFELQGLLSDIGLPCDLDAAVTWGVAGAIYVKGAQIWRFENAMTGPFHIDELNICSWYIDGEADWMRQRRRRGDKVTCNGDERLCPLKINQVTLPGLHNAGSGFAGGFGFLNCWMRNHGETIKRQLELGIRHLDIDPCYDTCGLVGSCHTFMCGGSICKIIKQVRMFLKENRDEVITINFNHEIVDPKKIFRGLTRQLKTQLKPLLNNKFRKSGEKRWPTLQKSIRSNKRLFVLYAPIIEQHPHSRYYQRGAYKWIHSESLYGSTWRPFSIDSGCEGIVPLTAERCRVLQRRELLEVSIIPESSGACITTLAETCKPYHHEALRACEPFRFQVGKSPNVLLVDYPEVERQEVTSVFHAVYHQNVRNILQHRPRECKVKVDAAVHMANTNISLFFVGKTIVMYSHNMKAQIDTRTVPGLNNIDAAYHNRDSNTIRVIQGCQRWDLEVSNFTEVPGSRVIDQTASCDQVDAAVTWGPQLYIFIGCHVTPQGLEPIPLEDWGLPCHLDAALVADNGRLFLFKGNNYWKYSGQEFASLEGRTLDWTIDAVQCDS